MTESQTTQLCTFRIAHMNWGVEVEQIQEVMLQQDMTHVPLMPDEVRGLINLRGQIVKAVDLRSMLGLGPARTPPVNVVLKSSGGAVALLVDDVGEVVTTGPSSIEPTPSNLSQPVSALARGIHKMNDSLLLILDAQVIQER